MAHDDWAKMDARLDSHPKIRKAGRNGREVFLFALRRRRLRHGGSAERRIPASDLEPWYLADQLMMSEADAEEGVKRAAMARLISVDAEEISILGFDDEWDGTAPMTAAQRKRSQRERERARRGGVESAGHGESRDDRDSHEASRDVRDDRDCHADQIREEEIRREEREDLSSGKPDAVPVLLAPEMVEPAADPVREFAQAAVAELNTQTGSRYQADSEMVLKSARALVARRYTASDAVAVVRAKSAAWRSDPKMAEYLRPATLLRPSNFAAYVEDLRAGNAPPVRASPRSTATDDPQTAIRKIPTR